jgi:glucan phosphoethanolaminetransferase (alkaline phosphatase superfamily)
MDSFKDGTELGTRDCRWFAGVFLFIWLVHFLIGALTMGVMFYVYSTITLAIVIIMLISIRPYKEHLHHHMYTNAIFLLLLALWNVACIGKVYAQQFQKMKGYIVVAWHFRNPSSALHIRCCHTFDAQEREVWITVNT